MTYAISLALYFMHNGVRERIRVTNLFTVIVLEIMQIEKYLIHKALQKGML